MNSEVINDNVVKYFVFIEKDFNLKNLSLIKFYSQNTNYIAQIGYKKQYQK